MKRLLCRWVEYYLALCEGDIERGLPGWVRRHLQVCAHCQAEVQAYARAREVVRQYAALLPDSPPAGWQPLQVDTKVEQRIAPLQLALAPAAAIVVVAIGFALWQQISTPVREGDVPPQVAQSVITPPRRETAMPYKKPAAATAAPSARGISSKQHQPKRRDLPEQGEPAPLPRQTPPGYDSPRRIVIAAQPKHEPVHTPHAEVVTEPSPEPVAPVQPVVVEAHPVTSAPVPEGYVIEAAYPAAGGVVE
ncbi:MAG: hypothetical protein NZ749_05070 [bacterium]|nr:hypothetical protein [bacterium]